MSLLIIGLLLVVGLAAIAGAVLLALGEQRSTRSAHSQATLPPPVAPPAPVLSVPISAPIPAPIEEHEMPTSRGTGQSAPIITGMSRPTRPLTPAFVDAEVTNALHTKNQSKEKQKELVILNGQFSELASELRDLYQQVWEFEQRLRTLTEMVDRIEQPANEHLNVEDEETQLYSASSRPLADSAQL